MNPFLPVHPESRNAHRTVMPEWLLAIHRIHARVQVWTCLLVFISSMAMAQKTTVHELRCEHKKNPMGIETAQPRMSWRLKNPGRNIMQNAYAIRVATSPSFSRNSLVWSSDKVSSDESVLIPYSGPPLRSMTRYYWQVRVWDNQDKASPWSEAAYWETGMMNRGDWKAKWIEPVQDTARRMPGLMVRKVFQSPRAVASARAYVTSHGMYELYLNNQKVGDEVLTPGWTSYEDRLQYQVYDVTSLINTGENVVGAMLGDGWYRGTLGWIDNWGIWGKKLGLLAQIEIRYTDGTTATIITDNSWRGTQNGPVIVNGIYDGEHYDARKEMKGWCLPGFDDAGWQPVDETENHDNLIATQSVPVRKIQEIKPVKIFRTPKGTLVADMGQNMVGWIRLKVSGPAGTTVTIRHAEVLDKYGEFYLDNLRKAEATAKYILKGDGVEVWEPRFTFFGFRYISLDGFPGTPTPDNLTGVVVHSDMEPTGSFVCSNPLINQLQSNILWGQKGNFLDVPTDCPQRDERLGWTGDAQAFCRTAAYNMDVAAFFTKWLKDLAADQGDEGQVPFVIPDVLRNNSTSAGWGDVATIAPWTMYQVYGDKRILETQYPSMKAYVEYIRKKAGSTYLWKGGSVFGDWLYYKPRMESHTEPDGYTNPDMIATMFFAYSTDLLARAAAVLGKTEDQKAYEALWGNIVKAFQQEYVAPSGRIASDSQTAYVLALHFNLLPENLRPKAAEHLVADIRRRKNHLSTGFLGTPYLCHVLSSHGQLETGYDLLLQETFPSWLYPVKMGATTIWERWDGQKTDSTFQDVGMNSFNHYAYGAVGDWMYRVVAGLEIGQPGYKEIRIQPQPDRRLTHAKATYESGYGTISSGWKFEGDNIVVEVTLPPNTKGKIVLPHARAAQVTEKGKPLSAVFQRFGDESGDVVIDTGSGQYVFQYPFQQ